MTEQEWLACADPTPMLEFLRGKVSDRKARLFAVACCRRIEYLPLFRDLPGREEDGRQAVLVAERYADGAATPEELDRAYWDAELGDGYQPFMTVAATRTETLFDLAFEALNVLAGHDYSRLEKCPPPNQVHLTRESSDERDRLQDQERTAQAELVRDLFGNPFRPITVDHSWLTSTVTALARQMYESHDFSAMPILADALQDAGCNNADVLDHCRQPGEHVRGCWAIDIILGKT